MAEVDDPQQLAGLLSNRVDSKLVITATAHATHPPGTDLDEQGHPIVKDSKS